MSLSPGKAVIDQLRRDLKTNRAGAWAGVAHLVNDPALKSLIARHLKLIKLLKAPVREPRAVRRRAQNPLRDRRSRATVCACGQPLPHPPRVKGLPADQRAILGRCFNYFVRRSYVNRSWRYRDAVSRRNRTAPARAARRANLLARWTARLDPRIVQTLGKEQALRQFVRAFNARIRPSRRLKDPLGEDPT